MGPRTQPELFWLHSNAYVASKGLWTIIHRRTEDRRWQKLPGQYCVQGSEVSCVTRELAEPITLFYKGSIRPGGTLRVRYRPHPDQPLVQERERLECELYFGNKRIHALYVL